MIKSILKALNALAGPKGGALEKACLSLGMYAAGKGWLPGDSASEIAAIVYAFISSGLTGAISTDTAKIMAINENENGVKVVPATAAARSVDEPIPTLAHA